MQPGDVICTEADVTDLIEETGYKPGTSINQGISLFINWYRNYYKVR